MSSRNDEERFADSGGAITVIRRHPTQGDRTDRPIVGTAQLHLIENDVDRRIAWSSARRKRCSCH